MVDVVTEFGQDKRLRQGSRAPRSFAILRVGKIKTKGHLGAALGHNFRERDTPNADLDRKGDNLVLKGPGTGKGVMEAWDDRAPEKVRKNAVHALEYFVGGSPEKIHAMSREDQDAYFRRALDWLEKRHGAENVLSAVIHRDETTPHMQALVIPLDARGKLNARELVGGKAKLSQMQTEFAQEVGQPFGFERGQERSKATHQTIKEYYGRANTPVEVDFSLPERRRGAVMGLGGESEGEWHQRASEAVSERLRHQTVHLGETARTMRRELDATEAALGQTQDELARERDIAEKASRLVVGALTLARESAPEEQGDRRKMASFYNHHAPAFTERQAHAIALAFDEAGMTIQIVEDGTYALTHHDLEALNGRPLVDRRTAETLLAGLHQAERSRQDWAEARQEMAERKARAQEQGQDSGSDWG